MTREIKVTNITYNRLNSYFPDMTPANAIRELFILALNKCSSCGKPELNGITHAHRDDTYKNHPAVKWGRLKQ